MNEKSMQLPRRLTLCDVHVGAIVQFVADGQPFHLARGSICRVYSGGGFDVALECLQNVREERCRMENYVLP